MDDKHSAAANLRQYRQACALEVERARHEGRVPVQPSRDFLSIESRLQMQAARERRERRAELLEERHNRKRAR